VLAVDFGPSCKFSLILGLKALFAIPPGAAAIKIISNVRGADDRQFSPPVSGVGKLIIAQIF
jgi:hypothetical protein